MYISSKISCKELASRNRIEGDKYYKIDCFLNDYLKQIIQVNQGDNFASNLFKNMLEIDAELERDAEINAERVDWYRNHITTQLMKLDDITLTFLINSIILID